MTTIALVLRSGSARGYAHLSAHDDIFSGLPKAWAMLRYRCAKR